MTARVAQAIAPYLAMFHALLDRRVPPARFEQEFLHAYKTDPTLWEGPVFDVLERVFTAVDEYVSDDGLRARAGGLDEDGLRESVREALARLET